MRRSAVIVGTLVVALAVAAGAFAGGRKQPPPFPPLPAGSTHAEINVKIAGELHTLILDRGRIVVAGPRNMLLHENDGTNVVIPLSSDTIVQPGNFTVYDLRRGMNVDAMRIDEGAAVRVRIRGKASVKAAGRLAAAP
jgi:hypothetical protein